MYTHACYTQCIQYMYMYSCACGLHKWPEMKMSIRPSTTQCDIHVHVDDEYIMNMMNMT